MTAANLTRGERFRLARENSPWSGLSKPDAHVGREKVARTPWYNAIYVSGIGAFKIAILTAMARHGDPDGSNVYPSANLIAREVGCDRGTVEKHVNESESLGWITADRRTDGVGRYIPGVRGRAFHLSIPMGF